MNTFITFFTKKKNNPKLVQVKSLSSPKFFRKKKHQIRKCRSLNNGIAQLALATTTTLAASVVGVEDVVKIAMEKCKESNSKDEHQPMMKYVDENIIGKDLVYDGPFGKRTVVYCDYTASGKSIRFIEDYIQDEVLPYYGNTHTTTTISSLQTSMLRSEAKNIIRKCMNTTDDDAVIFVSSGTTGAVLKLLHALELKDAPIVFISPFEHHSNLLPWLEIGAEVVYGEENSSGSLDLVNLEENLKKFSTKGRPIIGSFSAASNITGILNDTEAIATIMHRYNGYALFDYATAGPYVTMDMNPQNSDPRKDPLCYKDAIFCSVHKFVGGPGTPGLLVAKKNLFINPVPGDAGGGTVLFVTHKKHHYVENIEEREEGGTPAIVESIRAGLVFQLKQEVTSKRILDRDHELVKLAYAKWDPIPNLHILGKGESERLPIFSLVIEHPETKRFLHHNYVSSLLNDLFGIQARGGCACAGPYAEDLLGIDNDTAVFITEALLGDYSSWKDKFPSEDIAQVEGKSYSSLKPGFARLNLPYFMNEEVINYILDAVVFIAKHGWAFLPMYEMNPITGDFTHKESQALVYARRLTDVKHIMNPARREAINKQKIDVATKYKEALKQANTQKNDYRKKVNKEAPMNTDQFIPNSLDKTMRWFLLPSEAHAFLKGQSPPSAFGYEPMFYPRSPHALLKASKLCRTRLKSGLANVKFCTCPAKKARHIRTDGCKRFINSAENYKKLNNNNYSINSNNNNNNNNNENNICNDKITQNQLVQNQQLQHGHIQNGTTQNDSIKTLLSPTGSFIKKMSYSSMNIEKENIPGQIVNDVPIVILES